MNLKNIQFGGLFLGILLMLGAIGCAAQPGQSADPKPSIPSTFGTIPDSSPSPEISSQSIRIRPRSVNPSPQRAGMLKPMNPQLMKAQTDFSLKLFSTLQKQTPKQNIFISPISISQALSMLYNGASGETQQAIGTTLAFGDLALDTVNRANEDLRNALAYPDPSVELSLANAIWTNQNTPIKSNFLSRNQRFYQAKVESLDFKAAQSVQTINNWVKRNTQGKIGSIVEELKESDRLLLVNATYFKGAWTKSFNPERTTAQPFNTPDGAKNVQMMDQQGSYRYFETDQMQAIALPYGKRRLNLYLFMPKQGYALADLLPMLRQDNDPWLPKFAASPGRIQLPRFKVESNLQLEPSLTSLGMGIAFTSNANFSNLSDRPSQVDQVVHKTFVEVNESGTEAAAATAIAIRPTSVEISQPPFQMKVDRPFLCLLRDDQTGAILFIGAIVNP